MRLDPEALCAEACRETGHEDFGTNSFREGLDVLAHSIESESRLTAEALDRARDHLLRLLSTRLRIEQFHRDHPEVAGLEVPQPVFMIGLPRTGTTALAALLQRDPQRRSLLTWESGAPLPPPEAATRNSDPRIAQTQQGIDARHAALPSLRAMYDASATASTECHDLLGMEFRTQHFCGQYWVPSYTEWQRNCDMEPAYRYHRRVLTLLQWRCGPPRWHLHSPVHMFSLNDLERVFPDALFLMTHRDPAAVIGSVCSLIGTMLAMGSDVPSALELGTEQLANWKLGIERALRFRDGQREDRFADIHFNDLNADPVGTIAAAYDRLGLPFTDAARAGMGEWAAANPRGRHGSHDYQLANYGLDTARVRSAFETYIERFQIPAEA
ncbi:sulfotransferase [Myxococcota bacterium]|nr:sulfotransferase [Myxococcota bacterium]